MPKPDTKTQAAPAAAPTGAASQMRERLNGLREIQARLHLLLGEVAVVRQDTRAAAAALPNPVARQLELDIETQAQLAHQALHQAFAAVSAAHARLAFALADGEVKP